MYVEVGKVVVVAFLGRYGWDWEHICCVEQVVGTNRFISVH
jgi:hypothetical protein